MALFVDIVNITVKAGDGGNGCVAFHREKFVQAGGPDGGDGGRGGDVVFVASNRMHTLMDFRMHRKFAAGNGEDGSGGMRTGKAGADVVIQVPPGTSVRERSTGKLLLDLTEDAQRKVLVRGGKGGFGNHHFATPTRQAPQFARPGEKREPIEVTLELKSIADVGLVGFPNVGKSTILSIMTSARPKIANYHFTTLQPNLGIVSFDDQSYVLADIPGLVEGAAQGAGLGHDFLRHIERTRMLLHVVDISGSEYRDPLEDYDTILAELKAYGDLQNKPVIVVANKMDLPGAEENLQRLREKLGQTPVYPVSAAEGAKSFRTLNHAILKKLSTCPPVSVFEEEVWTPESTDDDAYQVNIGPDGFIVTGRAIQHLIDSVNFGNEESLNYFHHTLRKMGVIDALRAQGAQEGDTVIVGDMAFDFVE